MRNVLSSWLQYVEGLGENAEVIVDPWTEVAISSASDRIQPPQSGPHEFYFSRYPGEKPVRYLLVEGDPDGAAIYIQSQTQTSTSSTHLPQSSEYAEALEVQDLVDLIQSNDLSAHHILNSIRILDEQAHNMNASYAGVRTLLNSLTALGHAENVYKMLPSATVAIRTISSRLYESLDSIWCYVDLKHIRSSEHVCLRDHVRIRTFKH